jgi:translation initiation factor IF-3
MIRPPRAAPRNLVRVNHQIRSPEVRVISDTGSQIGVLSIGEALKMASSRGMDLVEVAPEATPPVCRVVDYGKFRYEQAKKHKGDSRHSHASKLKELKFHVNISDHDYWIKLRHASDFLQKSMRVKISVNFRGREMAHQEYGKQLMERILKDLAPHGHTDADPRLLGKNLHSILMPGKARPKPPQGGEAPVHSTATAGSNTSRPFGAAIKIDLKSEPQEATS